MAVRDLPSRATLEEVPGKVFRFVMGVSESVSARAALSAKGFASTEHAYAWLRLQKLAQMPNGGLDLDKTVRAAVVELDAWDRPNFEAIVRTLLREHPEQAEFLFENLEASDGDRSVAGVELLLDRLDLLESGQGREATREADRSALELLSVRGYPKAERQRLRGLVELSKKTSAAKPVNEDERLRILVELFRWYSDWSAQARNAITSRATLIRLGLAQRRRLRASEEAELGQSPPDVQPANGSATTTAPTGRVDQPTAAA